MKTSSVLWLHLIYISHNSDRTLCPPSPWVALPVVDNVTVWAPHCVHCGCYCPSSHLFIISLSSPPSCTSKLLSRLYFFTVVIQHFASNVVVKLLQSFFKLICGLFQSWFNAVSNIWVGKWPQPFWSHCPISPMLIFKPNSQAIVSAKIVVDGGQFI